MKRMLKACSLLAASDSAIYVKRETHFGLCRLAICPLKPPAKSSSDNIVSIKRADERAGVNRVSHFNGETVSSWKKELALMSCDVPAISSY
jgi:hypothetical protein